MPTSIGRARAKAGVVLGGPVEAVAEKLAVYARVGFRHPILLFRAPWDLETIRSLGAIREALAARAEVADAAT